MIDIRALVLDHEDWLIDRVIAHAGENGYLEYSSTLREAWRASINGLNLPIATALSQADKTSAVREAAVTTAIEFGVREAELHVPRGVATELFLGLLKLYRQGYLELISEMVPDPGDRQKLSAAILEIFDKVELGIARQSVRDTPESALERLSAGNRELTNEKNKYVTVFESIAEPAILMGADDSSVHVNAAGCRLFFGEKTPGTCYYGAIKSERSRALAGEILERVTEAGDQSELLDLETESGVRTFSVSIQEMLDVSGKFSGRVIILNDVTDYLAAIETAEEAARAKSAFLDTMSHEIKTPLNGILGLAGVIDADRLDPHDRRRLEAIQTSGKILLELVENILGFSRIEANALVRHDQDVDLHHLIDELASTVRPGAEAKGLRLKVHIAPDVSRFVRGDGQKLRHILLNLLSNAVKFTEQGDVACTVEVASTKPGDHRLRFVVEDTGVGIPTEDSAVLFQPFVQIRHPDERHALTGTGLGLAICKRLVAFLDGEITSSSRAGGGSRFTVTLPVELVDAKPAEAAPETELSVLVLEDDATNALVCEGQLLKLGHSAQLPTDYTTALRMVESGTFDLVVCDYHYGERTVADLLRHIRGSRDPRVQRLPVIVVSAAPPRPGDAALSGVIKYLEKPYSSSELRSAIEQAMRPEAHAMSASTDAHDTGAAKQPPLDHWETLERLLQDLGVERCERIVRSFQDSAPKLCDRISRSLAARDLAAATDTAHKLISAASFLGLATIESNARALTDTCAKRELRSAREMATVLRDAVREASLDLTAKLARYR